MAAALACKVCEEPLVLRLDPDEDNGENDAVPDDLELRCGCHFHWQCLMDQASEVALSLKCPSCSIYLPLNEAGPSSTNSFLQTPPGNSIRAIFVSEGGVEDNLDILPTLTEEAYLEAHPEARPARAFHIMCAEGDVSGIVELLSDVSEEIDDLAAFIRYQDPLAEQKSGLHLAVEKGQEETAWLLLWLCSTIPDDGFPPPARQQAESAGIGRLQVPGDGDIRLIRDAPGRTAADIAEQLRGPWNPMLQAGILRA